MYNEKLLITERLLYRQYLSFPFVWKINALFTGLIHLYGWEHCLIIHFCIFSFFKCHLSFQLFSVIVFGCISSQGWTKDKLGKETCLYNGDSNACNYGVGISVIAFMASIGFIVGEYFFEQMSSIKTRKHYVMADMGFSGECTDQISFQGNWLNLMAFASFASRGNTPLWARWSVQIWLVFYFVLISRKQCFGIIFLF